MPYSFTKIEQDKSKVIRFVFFFLVIFYFLTVWLIVLILKNYDVIDHSYMITGSPRMHFYGLTTIETGMVFVIALIVGASHWAFSTHRLVERMCAILGAESLNPKDTFHQMFQNIIEEVSIATGGKKMEGVVVPTMAMNAFALADFEGRAVIGVTEGLLAKLTRAQLEAVVGHEAAHIVSGDCLSTTVTTSIFKLYGSVLSNMRFSGDDDDRLSYRSGAAVFLIFVLMSIIETVSSLLNMFISRQREFRADAISVRLTRDPLSLAQALYTITYRWRGAGLNGDNLEAIFIVNPSFNQLDEKEGLLADLLSTHPPVKKRLQVLLDMAHTDIKDLEEQMTKDGQSPRVMVPDDQPANIQSIEWIAHNNGQWLGPFSLDQLRSLDWIRPDSWVKRIGGEHIKRAFEDSSVSKLFQKETANPSHLLCPRCQLTLQEEYYEGLVVLKCLTCQGVLVKGHDVQRIIIREVVGFSDRLKKMAEAIRKDDLKFSRRKIDLKTAKLLICPQCKNNEVLMNREYFTAAYYVEVDRCVLCGYVWFDKDELELLQYLIEEQIKVNTKQSLNQN